MRKSKKNKFQKVKLIAQMYPKSPITEQYRTIRTNIQYSSVDTPIRTLMVTSTGPSEGKSTTITNLAVVFAQQGQKVLLVDTDLRRPAIHYPLNLSNRVGLTNILTRQMSIEDAIQSADMDNLYAITSGPIPPNPAELLSSKTMKQVINDVSEHFDLVMFDTPPILSVTDAQIMANQTDGSILVVSSGSTDKEAAMKARELLSAAKAKLLGAVLNNKKLDKTSHYYYDYSMN